MINTRVDCRGVRRLGRWHFAEAAGFTDLAEPDLRALNNGGDVLDAQRGAGLRLEEGFFDVVDVPVEADLANVNLLLALFDEASTGVGVVVGELLLNLADAEPVGDEFVGIDADLVLARHAAEAGDVDNAGDGLQLLLDGPVLERLELHIVVEGVGAAQRVPVNLTDGTPVGADLWLQARGERNL